MEAAFRPLLSFLQNVIVEIAIFIIFNRVARIHARKNDAHAISEEIKSAEMDGEPNQARAKLDRGSQEKGVDEGNAVRGAIPQEKHQKENRQPNQEVDDPGHQYNFLLFAHVFSGRSISQPRIFRSVPFEGNQIQEGAWALFLKRSGALIGSQRKSNRWRVFPKGVPSDFISLRF